MAQPVAYRIDSIAGAGERVGDGGSAVAAFLHRPLGLARDSHGSVYVADSGNHRIRRIDPDGTIRTIAGTGFRGVTGDDGPAVEATLWEPRSVAIGLDGSILIGDGSARIRRITPDGRINTIAGNGQEGWSGDGGSALNASIGVPAGIAVDSAGNIYFSDALRSVVRKITPSGTISLVAGTGQAGFSGDGGPAFQAQLDAPLQLAISEAGTLLIADYGNLRIREVGADGTIRTVAGGGQGADGSDAASVFLAYPCAVVPDGAGGLFVGQADGRIRRIGHDGVTSTIASASPQSEGDPPRAKLPDGSTPCSLVTEGNSALLASDEAVDLVTRVRLGDGGPVAEPFAGSIPDPDVANSPLETHLLLPAGLAQGPGGDLYFADTEEHKVYQWKAGGTISVIAGTGSPGFSGDGGPATEAQLTGPAAVAVDPSGTVWIADSLNHRIRKVGSDGVISTVASDNADDDSQSISVPVDVAAGPFGNIYFLELGKNTVRKIDSSGKISVFAGGDEAGYSGDGGPAVSARLRTPVSVYAAGTGDLFIADAGNSVVRRVDRSGIITTVAGGGAVEQDGVSATQSALTNPVRVAVDSDGCLLIAEQTGASAGRIRRVDADGRIWTVAGNGLPLLLGDGGLATHAGIGSVGGLATGLDGAIFLTDASNGVIRKLTAIRPAHMSIAGGDQQTVALNEQASEPLAVVVTDSSGIPIPGITVSFQVTAGDVASLDASAATDENGVAMAGFQAGTTAGAITISAAAAGADQVRFSATSVDQVPVSPPTLLDYTISTIAGNATAAAQAGVSFTQPIGLTFDDSGRAYVADSGAAAVRRLDIGGACVTVAGFLPGGFCGTPAGGGLPSRVSPAGVAVSGHGDVYFSDRSGHRVYRVDAQGAVTVVAGTGVPGFSGDGGPANVAQLNQPASLLLSKTGTLYISDTGNVRVRAVAPDGLISTVAGNGHVGSGGDGGYATDAPLVAPAGLAESSSGALIIADQGAYEVKAVSPDGLIKIVAGTGKPPSPDQAQTDKPTLALDNPAGVAAAGDGSLYIGEKGRIRHLSPDGSQAYISWPSFGEQLWPAIYGNVLYVLDTDNATLYRYEPDGTFTRLAGSRFFGDGGQATDASLSYAGGLTLDKQGDLYFSDTLNNRIRKIDPAGVVTTIAGDGEAESSGDGGPATEAGLVSPAGLAIHPDGTLDVAEAGGARVRRISPSGIITTIAGTGKLGDSGDGGPARAAAFLSPSALALDSDGNLFVADSTANRVRKISPDGIVTALAGVGGDTDSTDIALRAVDTPLNGPSALAVDGAGNVYIADRLNNRILKVFRSGAIIRVAGTGQRRTGLTGGLAVDTQLNRPSGVAVDAAGNLYITDESQRIFKVSPSGIIETVAGRGPAGFDGDGSGGSGALLNGPGAILVDTSGNIIFSDQGNRRIRKLTPGPSSQLNATAAGSQLPK